MKRTLLKPLHLFLWAQGFFYYLQIVLYCAPDFYIFLGMWKCNQNVNNTHKFCSKFSPTAMFIYTNNLPMHVMHKTHLLSSFRREREREFPEEVKRCFLGLFVISLTGSCPRFTLLFSCSQPNLTRRVIKWVPGPIFSTESNKDWAASHSMQRSTAMTL